MDASHLSQSSTPSRSESRGARRSGVDPSPSEITGVASLTGRLRAVAVDQRDRHAQPSSATPRPEMTGIALASPRDSGSARIAARAALDAAGGGLVGDDVEDGVAVARLLDELGDGDALGRELLRDAREHAGAILDLEPQVEGRRELARRQPLEVAPDGVVLEESGAGRADDGDHVGDDRRRRLDAAGAGPLERDLADRVALQHHRVECALDRGERVVAVDERRADAHVDAVADEARPPDQLHVHVERARGGDVVERDALDPLDLDPVERHAGAERDRRQDRGLRGRVEPADVLGRIGLGEAEPLRLGEGVAVRAPLLHRGEDEVRRPVDDPEHAVHVRDDERLAQHLDHGDRGAHGRLEPELDAARGGRLEELGAAAGDELLVRGHDGASGAEQLEHVAAGRVDAAHHLGHDLDRRVAEDRRRSRR